MGGQAYGRTLRHAQISDSRAALISRRQAITSMQIGGYRVPHPSPSSLSVM